MSVLLNLATIAIIIMGFYCLVFPRLPGLLIILSGAAGYCWLTDFQSYQHWLAAALIMLGAAGQAACYRLRIYLTRCAQATRRFSVDAVAGNVAGAIACEAALGPLIGVVLWQLVVGKILFAKWTSVANVLKRLALVAALRLLCGFIMVVLIVHYILIDA